MARRRNDDRDGLAAVLTGLWLAGHAAAALLMGQMVHQALNQPQGQQTGSALSAPDAALGPDAAA